MIAAEAQQVNLDAPYRYVEQAVRAAYATEAQAIVEVSSYFTDLRGSTVPLPGRQPLSQHDRHAQAAMVLVFVEKHLAPIEHVVVRARRTIATSGMLRTRKEVDVQLLHQWFIVEHREPRDAPSGYRDYAMDAIRGWAGLRRLHREKWWADRLGRDLSRLYRWRYGDRHRRQIGFLSRIEGVYQDAMGKLAEPMYATGLTQE